MSTVSALALIILYPIRASFAQCGISPHLIKKGTACLHMRSLCDVPRQKLRRLLPGTP